MTRAKLFLALLVACSAAYGQSETTVRYLANEGVMVSHEETKILFDPLFDNGFGQYQLVPTAMRKSILAGDPPYDGVDAVFISHYHGDHFSAEAVLQLLRAQTGIRLYGPIQAVTAIRQIASAEDEQILDRLVGIELEYGDPPMHIRPENLLIEAVRIPHSGWPTARTEVQNIAFRVTLEESSTVLHMGDADPRVIHFSADEDYWQERRVDLALPPYWFFRSDGGREVLEDWIDVRHAIGIHVPTRFARPADRPAELLGYELFTDPGEGRRFTGSQ